MFKVEIAATKTQKEKHFMFAIALWRHCDYEYINITGKDVTETMEPGLKQEIIDADLVLDCQRKRSQRNYPDLFRQVWKGKIKEPR